MNIAIIVAGGASGRFESEVPKSYVKYAGKQVFKLTIEAFLKSEKIDYIQPVIARGHEDLYENLGFEGDERVLKWCYGGFVTRQESVYEGLKAIEGRKPNAVLIHDAARPFIPVEIIDNVIDKLIEGAKGVIPVLPVNDTIKTKDFQKVDRDNLIKIQTPQGFDYPVIYQLHKENIGVNATDDSSLLLDKGYNIETVMGSEDNIKITRTSDMPKIQKIGQGYDIHVLEQNKDRYLMLGGIEIESDLALVGHSDADVVLHAITDAVLGACGQGDIGEHFSDKDERWKNASSDKFLKHAVSLLSGQGGSLVNIDVTVIAEQPKLSAYKARIKEKVAEICDIDALNVNIKATTNEKQDSIGRGEAIVCNAIVSVLI